jgi:hypothetical protein
LQNNLPAASACPIARGLIAESDGLKFGKRNSKTFGANEIAVVDINAANVVASTILLVREVQ